jgi:hypothetical protein
MSFSLRRSPFLSFAVLALLVSACASPIRPRGIDSEGLVVGRLKSVNPLEVVVPRIENKTGKTDLPLSVMRDDFQKGLVALRYSPLSLDFVDRNVNVTEASYSPGTLGEQATLKVVLTNWDSSRWNSHATLVVDADVYLLDANDPDPAHALWGGHTTRSVDLSRQRQQFISDEAMLRRAVELTVDGILVALPSRDPEKAPTNR